MQREEIVSFQGLRDWYGIQCEPSLREDGRRMIEMLERAQPGANFNHLFYQVFSRHHYMLM